MFIDKKSIERRRQYVNKKGATKQFFLVFSVNYNYSMIDTESDNKKTSKPPQSSVTNNDILKKLRIALELKDADIIEILKLADFEISKTELSALFRNPEHKNYMECGNQLLRRFLDGLIIKKRGLRRRRLVRTINSPGL